MKIMKRYAVKGTKHGVSTIILYPDEERVERTKQMLIDEGYIVEVEQVGTEGRYETRFDSR